MDNWSTAVFPRLFDKYRWGIAIAVAVMIMKASTGSQYEQVRNAIIRSERWQRTSPVCKALHAYLHGSRDVTEPESLYLWDAAARPG